LSQHLVLVRQLRVIAQTAQLLSQVLDQIDDRTEDENLVEERDARDKSSHLRYDALSHQQTANLVANINTCSGRTKRSRRRRDRRESQNSLEIGLSRRRHNNNQEK